MLRTHNEYYLSLHTNKPAVTTQDVIFATLVASSGCLTVSLAIQAFAKAGNVGLSEKAS